MAPPQRRLFVGLQGLRAFAALAIVFSHVAHDGIAAGLDPSGLIGGIYHGFAWDAGVDMFFVISGFIIATSSTAYFGGGAAAAGRFVLRRCQRIVPLYWAASLLFLLTALATPGAVHGVIGPGGIIASFLFIPWPRPDGVMQPALGLGWTLNYEMFFYALFAASLFLPRARALPALVAVLVLLVMAGAAARPATPQLGFWTSPLILEFGAGLLLAMARGLGLRLPLLVRLALPPLALWWLHAHAGAELNRVAAWAPAALMLVAAATLGPNPGPPGRWATRLVVLGEASYALYLIHPFVMRALSVTFHKFHGRSEAAGLMYIFTGLVLAQLCAWVVHVHLDARLQAWFRRQRSTRSKAEHETLQMPGL